MHSAITIVGAGIAGLACGQRLRSAGHRPLLLDKGRGIGGRMATRRVQLSAGEIRFDHGAQYLTARDPAFVAALQALGPACARWEDGAAEAHLVGVPGMSSLARAMAAGLDSRLATEVVAVRAIPDGWALDLGESVIETRHLVLTIPAPQAARLLEPGHALQHRLAKVAMAPCLTLMAAFPTDAPRPFAALASDDQHLAWIAQDSSKPGRAGHVTGKVSQANVTGRVAQANVTSWVAQASAEWSEQHLEDTPEAIAARMLPILATRIGVAPERALHASAHRWRYARTVAPLGAPFLGTCDGTLHLGGDWCLGARVEAAWQSGTAIADAILARLDGQ